jgi:hypothetical protein
MSLSRSDSAFLAVLEVLATATKNLKPSALANPKLKALPKRFFLSRKT